MARSLAIAATIVILLGVAVGCGDDGERDPTIQTYFDGLNAIATDTGPRVEAFITEIAGVTPLPDDVPAEERLAHGRQLHEELLSLQQASLERWRDLNPPPELADTHQAYLDAAEASAAWLEAFPESEEFDGLILGTDVGTSIVDAALEAYGLDAELLQQASDACADLAAFAADHDIAFGLECLAGEP